MKTARRLRGLVVLGSIWVVPTACDRGLGPDTAAVAGDFRFQVEDAARMLAPISSLPNDADVAETTVDFWTDYVLLTWVVNSEDGLEETDLSSVVDQELRRRLVLRLRDEVIQVDTVISDEELRNTFDEQRPGEEVRARHILLSTPPEATPAQQDSIRALAEEIRDRARGGEDFGSLAEQYSHDPGSAIEGGDLGFFGRGVMVPPFEDAAFALEPGEVSDVVQSSFGLHVILLDERRSPVFEQIAEDYRVRLLEEREMVAESTYLARLEEPANVRLGEDAISLVRSISAAPQETLSRSEGSRPLAFWEGGELPAEEYREFVASQPRDLLQQISVAQDAQLETLLRDLARDRLLLAEVERAGIEAEPGDREAIIQELQSQYRAIANALGVDSLEVAEGSTMRDTVEEEVLELMRRVVANEVDVIPLGPLGVPLRARYRPEVAGDAPERIVARVAELRALGGSPSVPEPGVPTDTETAPSPEPGP